MVFILTLCNGEYVYVGVALDLKLGNKVEGGEVFLF